MEELKDKALVEAGVQGAEAKGREGTPEEMAVSVFCEIEMARARGFQRGADVSEA